MCMNCGCGELNERHGKDTNITTEDVMQAARSNGQDFNETVRNMEASLQQVEGGSSAKQPGSTGMGRGPDDYRTS